jgi:hypothetical protein
MSPSIQIGTEQDGESEYTKGGINGPVYCALRGQETRCVRE